MEVTVCVPITTLSRTKYTVFVPAPTGVKGTEISSVYGVLVSNVEEIEKLTVFILKATVFELS